MEEHRPQLNAQLQAELRTAGYPEPEVVPVVPQPGCHMMNCWANVATLIKSRGGLRVPGYAVWAEKNGRWLLLEAHAVWQLRDGSCIDPTPHEHNDTSIIFVRESLNYRGDPIPSLYIQTDNRPDTTRFLEIHRKYHPLQTKLMAGRMPTPAEYEIMKGWAEVVKDVFPDIVAKRFRRPGE